MANRLPILRTRSARPRTPATPSGLPPASGQFLPWLDQAVELGVVDGDPFTDPHACDGVAWDYRHPLTARGRKLSTVNAHLTAVDDFCCHLEPAAAKHQEVHKAAPRALADVRISARKGVLVVRYGKGGKYREARARRSKA